MYFKIYFKKIRGGADSPFAVPYGVSGNGRCASRMAGYRYDHNADTSSYPQSQMVSVCFQGKIYALPYHYDCGKHAFTCGYRSYGTQRNGYERTRSSVYVWAYQCYDSKKTSPCNVILVIYPYGYPYRSAYESNDSKAARQWQNCFQRYPHRHIRRRTLAVPEKRYHKLYHVPNALCFS